MSYPIKLGKPEGRRRLALLKVVKEKSSVTMTAMASHGEREDLRWLWRADLVQVVDDHPLRYGTTLAGDEAIAGEEAELAELARKAEKKRLKEEAEAA